MPILGQSLPTNLPLSAFNTTIYAPLIPETFNYLFHHLPPTTSNSTIASQSFTPLLIYPFLTLLIILIGILRPFFHKPPTNTSSSANPTTKDSFWKMPGYEYKYEDLSRTLVETGREMPTERTRLLGAQEIRIYNGEMKVVEGEAALEEYVERAYGTITDEKRETLRRIARDGCVWHIILED